ncbi:hypothetical protein, partial [Staphylococcus aureus]|uniref:hypothetical protein n=1 Tax=Staphylococcus aureus TaxID=1280 RepID=UPI0039BE974D
MDSKIPAARKAILRIPVELSAETVPERARCPLGWLQARTQALRVYGRLFQAAPIFRRQLP